MKLTCNKIKKLLEDKTGVQVSVVFANGVVKVTYSINNKLFTRGITTSALYYLKMTDVEIFENDIKEKLSKNSPGVFNLEVGTLMIDNQDGGYTTYVFPSFHDAIDEKRKRVKAHLEDEDENFSDWDYEYECGYLGKETIPIKIVNGVPQLAAKFSIHSGQ